MTPGKCRKDRGGRGATGKLWADGRVIMDSNFGDYKANWNVRLDWQ